MSRRLALRALFAYALWSGATPTLQAQRSNQDSLTPGMFAGDEWERYARALQVGGQLPIQLWSLRGFSPQMQRRLGRDTGQHPWDAQVGTSVRVERDAVLAPLPGEIEVIYNSSFPHGWNDGALWAGRGITTVIRGGVAATFGPLTVTLRPIFFRAENDAFRLRDNGLVAPYSFGDAFHPKFIDQPQRFGGSPYQQLNPDNSTIRLDVVGAGIGFSTAEQIWGPAIDHPLILGTNAGGFPHLFIESSTPVRLGILRFHGRALWGRLEQSEYIAHSPRSRLAVGLIGVMGIDRIPGFEIGGARFFHVQWTDSVLSAQNLLLPLGGLLKVDRIGPSGNPFGNEPDNQIASLFVRWAFQRSGVELFGEIAREDHSWNGRDLMVEPDHMAGYMIGLLRTWTNSDSSRRSVLRMEALNTRLTSLVLVRGQTPFYHHDPLRQGHTHLGQVLGSAAANGGGGATVAFDRYSRRGRLTLRWSRLMRAENWPSTVPDPFQADVLHELSVEGLDIRPGRRTGIMYELTAVHEVNRHFGADAFNLRVAAGARVTW